MVVVAMASTTSTTSSCTTPSSVLQQNHRGNTNNLPHQDTAVTNVGHNNDDNNDYANNSTTASGQTSAEHHHHPLRRRRFQEHELPEQDHFDENRITNGTRVTETRRTMGMSSKKAYSSAGAITTRGTCGACGTDTLDEEVVVEKEDNGDLGCGWNGIQRIGNHFNGSPPLLPPADGVGVPFASKEGECTRTGDATTDSCQRTEFRQTPMNGLVGPLMIRLETDNNCSACDTVNPQRDVVAPPHNEHQQKLSRQQCPCENQQQLLQDETTKEYTNRIIDLEGRVLQLETQFSTLCSLFQQHLATATTAAMNNNSKTGSTTIGPCCSRQNTASSDTVVRNTVTFAHTSNDDHNDTNKDDATINCKSFLPPPPPPSPPDTPPSLSDEDYEEEEEDEDEWRKQQRQRQRSRSGSIPYLESPTPSGKELVRFHQQHHHGSNSSVESNESVTMSPAYNNKTHHGDHGVTSASQSPSPTEFDEDETQRATNNSSASVEQEKTSDDESMTKPQQEQHDNPTEPPSLRPSVTPPPLSSSFDQSAVVVATGLSTEALFQSFGMKPSAQEPGAPEEQEQIQEPPTAMLVPPPMRHQRNLSIRVLGPGPHKLVDDESENPYRVNDHEKVEVNNGDQGSGDDDYEDFLDAVSRTRSRSNSITSLAPEGSSVAEILLQQAADAVQQHKAQQQQEQDRQQATDGTTTSHTDSSNNHDDAVRAEDEARNNDPVKNKWLEYLNSVQEATPDVDEQMKEFVQVPANVESMMSFGFFICVDSFLYTITIVPIRFVWSCLLLILKLQGKGRGRRSSGKLSTSPKKRHHHRHHEFRFHRRHMYQLIQVTILFTISYYLLGAISIGRFYHWIRGQSMIKLYVLIAIVEVFDRLLSSMGQDCMDSMYWNTVSRPTSVRMLISVLVVFIYCSIHSLLLFVHVETLNVAVNSADQALLTLLISGNFSEIKSSVFKKYNKAGLFKITAADICERFKLAIFLSLVFVLNLSQGMNRDQFMGFLRTCGLVWCAEVIADWIKHAFITKFNFLPARVYPDYSLLLAGDVTGIGHEGYHLDHSHAVVRRLGFAQIPLVCVSFRLIREAAKYAARTNSIFGQMLLLQQDSWIRWIALWVPVWLFLLATKLALGNTLQRISLSKLHAAPEYSQLSPALPKKKKNQ